LKRIAAMSSPAADPPECQLAMPAIADGALFADLEVVLEERRREALAPDLSGEEVGGVEIQVTIVERPVGIHRPGEIGRRDEPGDGRLERRAEAFDVVRLQAEPGRRRVTAELRDQPRIAPVDEIERVAQMQRRDRPSRPP
jgi:hypothetical protein